MLRLVDSYYIAVPGADHEVGDLVVRVVAWPSPAQAVRDLGGFYVAHPPLLALCRGPSWWPHAYEVSPTSPVQNAPTGASSAVGWTVLREIHGDLVLGPNVDAVARLLKLGPDPTAGTSPARLAATTARLTAAISAGTGKYHGNPQSRVAALRATLTDEARSSPTGWGVLAVEAALRILNYSPVAWSVMGIPQWRAVQELAEAGIAWASVRGREENPFEAVFELIAGGYQPQFQGDKLVVLGGSAPPDLGPGKPSAAAIVPPQGDGHAQAPGVAPHAQLTSPAELSAEQLDELLHMEDAIEQTIVGQHAAVAELSDIVRGARAGLKAPGKPDGVVLMTGPSGVGKTELAKCIAAFMGRLYGFDIPLVRLDMSEYQERWAIARLLGSEPGYIGYDEGGQLTNALLENPIAVVLLDEIDKAHPNVVRALMQAFDEGRLTDGHGRTVDMTGALILMTANYGSSSMRLGGDVHVGFIQPVEDLGEDGMRREIHRAVAAGYRDQMSPEIRGRITHVIEFAPLGDAEIARIAAFKLAAMCRRVHDNDGVDVTVSPTVRVTSTRRWSDSCIRLWRRPCSRSTTGARFVLTSRTAAWW